MAAYNKLAYSSVREVVYVFFRHKWSIFLIFILVSAAVAGVTYVWPKTYESNAQLIMRIGREDMPVDPSMPNTLVNVTQDRTSQVKSVMSILKDQAIAEEVVARVGEGWILDRPNLRREPLPIEDEQATGIIGMAKRMVRGANDTLKDLLVTLKLKEDLSFPEQAVQRVVKGLEVEVEKQTNIVDISFNAKQADLSKVVLDMIIDLYLERHTEVFASQVGPQVFEVEVAKQAESLAAAEDELEAFRQARNIADLSKQRDILIDQISVQEIEAGEQLAAVQALAAQVKALEETLQGMPATHELSRVTGRPNFAADAMKEELIRLTIEEADLAQRYPDSHRPLQDVRAQIARVEARLAKEPETLTEVTRGLDANREAWEHTLESERANLAAAQARYDVMAQELGRLQERLAVLASSEIELERLIRKRDLAEEEYRSYVEDLRQARKANTMQTSGVANVSVAQAPSLPIDPIRPKKLRNIGLGMLIGLFGGVAFAFLLEFLDDSLNTVEDVERKLGVPVLASVSEKEFKACI